MSVRVRFVFLWNRVLHMSKITKSKNKHNQFKSITVLTPTAPKDRNRFYNYKSIPNRYKPIMKPILTILTGLHLIFSKFETKGRFLNIRHMQHTYKWHIRDIGILTRSHQLQTFTKPIKINRFALTGYMLRISKICQWELDLFSCEIGYCTCQK